MDHPDCIKLVVSLCLPSSVVGLSIVSKQHSRVSSDHIYIRYCYNFNDTGEYKRMSSINSMNHGTIIWWTDPDYIQISTWYNSIRTSIIFIRDYPRVCKFDMSIYGPPYFSAAGSPSQYNLFIFHHDTTVYRVDYDEDFRIVGYATPHTKGLLTLS